jgi:hypothetical protein
MADALATPGSAIFYQSINMLRGAKDAGIDPARSGDRGISGKAGLTAKSAA